MGWVTYLITPVEATASVRLLTWPVGAALGDTTFASYDRMRNCQQQICKHKRLRLCQKH
jgi:hypothetical protein